MAEFKDSDYKDSIDYTQNPMPICPYCDVEIRDIEEYFSYPEETAEIECDECEGKFTCEIITQISYSTSGDCEVHKLARFDEFEYTCQVCKSVFYDWHLDGHKHERLKKHQYEIVRERKDNDL